MIPCGKGRAARRQGAWWLIVVASGLAVGVGCRPPTPEPSRVEDVVERGPFRLVVSVTPAEVWVGDPLEIDVRVTTPQRHEVVFPDAPTALPGFDVSDTRAPLPIVTADDEREWSQTYVLDVLTTGTVEIPPITVQYTSQPVDDPSALNESAYDAELTSDPLEVSVRSVLTTQDSMMSPRGITGMHAPSIPRWPWWVYFAIGSVIVVLIFVLAVVVRAIAGGGASTAPPLPPEIWALRALRELAARGLATHGAVREHYYQLSEIVRRYVEGKFRLAAPEMTTEEFLRVLAVDETRLPTDPRPLAEFLEACDLVKYAAFEPGPDDAEGALEKARAFVNASAAAAAALDAEAPASQEPVA